MQTTPVASASDKRTHPPPDFMVWSPLESPPSICEGKAPRDWCRTVIPNSHRRPSAFGVAEAQENYLCPKCGAPCKVNFLAEGFTKRPLPLDPQFIEKPLRAWVRKLLLMDSVLDEDRPLYKSGRSMRYRRFAAR